MIMLVDDFPSTLMVLERMLSHANYQVRSFASGKLALEAVDAVKPDLILLDVQMPEMDGYEVCTQLKANPRLAGTPVLFLSAADEPMDKVKAFNVGASDYLTKPYHPAEILSRVGIYLKVQKLQDELDALHDAGNAARLQELEELLGEFSDIISHGSKSPLSTISNSLNGLKSGVQGKLDHSDMTNLDAAVANLAKISQLFQKCQRAMNAQAQAKKTPEQPEK